MSPRPDEATETWRDQLRSEETSSLLNLRCFTPEVEGRVDVRGARFGPFGWLQLSFGQETQVEYGDHETISRPKPPGNIRIFGSTERPRVRCLVVRLPAGLVRETRRSPSRRSAVADLIGARGLMP